MIASTRIGANTLLLNTSFAGPALAEVVARENVDVLIYDEEFAGIVETATAERDARPGPRLAAEHRQAVTAQVDDLMSTEIRMDTIRPGHGAITPAGSLSITTAHRDLEHDVGRSIASIREGVAADYAKHLHAIALDGDPDAGLYDVGVPPSILRFGDYVPRTFISRDPAELRGILDELGGQMIVKPVYGFGGREILLARAEDPNLGSLLELATAEGSRWTVAQEYLPAAAEGDKRILLVDGEPIGAVLRVPAKGELRNNFHAGGSPVKSELTERDRAICSAVGPMLREADQFFVGIDVIGGHLTEINVTSPTGMQEINRLQGLEGAATMQARFWDALEARIHAGPARA